MGSHGVKDRVAIIGMGCTRFGEHWDKGNYDRMTMERSLYGPEALEGWRVFSQRRNPDWVPPDMRTQGRL